MSNREVAEGGGRGTGGGGGGVQAFHVHKQS